MTELLFMDSHSGSYLRRFTARVTGAQRGPEGPNLELDRSAFYPLGGGQPSDQGLVSWEGGQAHVQMVRKKHRVRHFVAEQDPLPAVGTPVEAHLDWERRYAHMRMHTAQHLVSAVVDELHSALTVGNQIGARCSRIDFAPLKLEAGQLGELEAAVNERIEADLPLTIQTRERSELEGNPLVRANLARLPPHIQQLRVIAISDIDLCPCAGTHVRSLGEIGTLRFTKSDNKGAGKRRLTYVLE